MKILIVGGGAVGQVFGYLLHRGGADITYLLKPQYLQEAQESGFTLYNARSGKRYSFDDFDCIENLTEQSSFDQVWITVASDACCGNWWQQLVAQIKDATVVYFQPDLENKQRITTASQVVQGMIQFIAYQSPLPNETNPQWAQQVGVTYYTFPLTAMAIFAPRNETTKSIQQILARAHVKVSLASAEWLSFRYAKIAALSIPAMAVLETVDWKLSHFRQRSSLARQAIRQALQVVCAHYQKRYWCYGPLIFLFCWILGYSNHLTSAKVPMERFLQFHFEKVGPQTRLMLRQYIQHGNDLSMDTNVLDQLLNKLDNK